MSKLVLILCSKPLLSDMSKSQKVMKSGKSSLNKSRASQSQTQSVASQSQHLSEEEFKELVADIVKYILHRHFEGKVTRRTKIRDDIIKSKTRKFDQLMEKVKSRFEKVSVKDNL